MGINFYTNYTNYPINNISFQTEKPVRKNVIHTEPDSFVKESKEAFFTRRLEELFPNDELNKTYNAMCENLGLDYKPALNLTIPVSNNAGGGYTFHNNLITISLEDTLGSDMKIYGLKDGEKFLQYDDTGIPVMLSKTLASYLTNTPRAAKNKGCDKLIAERASDDEIRKLFLLKLYHELIHAKQHMIMRQTEDIGAKNIIKAWCHIPSKQETFAAKSQLEDILYKKSYWANKETPIKYDKNSEMYELAQKYINAVENYVPVGHHEYKTNFLELEAFRESQKYITEHYGNWE